MSDFFQNGVITTFQELGPRDYGRLEAELAEYARQKPVALVLPCLFSELSGRAVPRIVDELKKIGYLNRIVVTLGNAGPGEYREAREYFSQLPQPVSVLWNDGPRIREVKEEMRDHNLLLGESGKGLAVWMAIGLTLGDSGIRAVAHHDCDILSYDRILMHRLVYPLLNPVLDYEFSKGYYARVSGRLYGRATRIFVTPLVRALEAMLGHQPFLSYLDSFRYLLAGEFCMSAELARIHRIPSDWGLEVGTLAEIYRNCSTNRICQVDLGIDYEHRHQEAGIGDPHKGLMRMARETSLTVFHALAAEGAQMPASFFRTLRASYLRAAQDAIRQYADLSTINGLDYDRHAEDVYAENFARSLDTASKEFLKDPLGAPPIPNWNRVKAAMPDVFEQLREAVERDSGVVT